MVTLKSLQGRIKKQRDKLAMAQKREVIRLEKLSLQRELKELQRKPSTKKNVLLAKRVGRGLKICVMALTRGILNI